MSPHQDPPTQPEPAEVPEIVAKMRSLMRTDNPQGSRPARPAKPSVLSALAKRAKKAKRAPRNRKQEEETSTQRRTHKLVTLSELRRDGKWGELLMIAQALVVCGLPYQRTDERQITRKARLGDGTEVSITFTCARPAVEMPYGSDRTLLHWMIDRAIRAGSPFVSWETATSFLEDAGMSDAGKNFLDLRSRYRRLSGLAITVERTLRGQPEETLIMPIIKRSRLPSSIDVRAERQGQLNLFGTQYGFQLDEDFFQEVLAHHVPVPWALVRSTRNQSQLQDLMVFWFWRAYASKRASLIPWKALRLQLWQEDHTHRRIKVRFREALMALQAIDPDFPGEVRDEGLWVRPYRGFLPEGETLETRPKGTLT